MWRRFYVISLFVCLGIKRFFKFVLSTLVGEKQKKVKKNAKMSSSTSCWYHMVQKPQVWEKQKNEEKNTFCIKKCILALVSNFLCQNVTSKKLKIPRWDQYIHGLWINPQKCEFLDASYWPCKKSTFFVSCFTKGKHWLLLCIKPVTLGLMKKIWKLKIISCPWQNHWHYRKKLCELWKNDASV